MHVMNIKRVLSLFSGGLILVGVFYKFEAWKVFDQLDHAENIQIVEGKILRFAPYFNTAMSMNPDGDLRRTSPLATEGVEVTIEFRDEIGDRQSFHETWWIPAIDRFKCGDSIPVVWVNALMKNPKSLIEQERKLRSVLRRAQRSNKPARDPHLREQRSKEIRTMLDEYALLFKQFDDYYKKFHKQDKWNSSKVRYRYVKRDALKEYDKGAKERLQILRRELGMTPRGGM